MICRAEITLCRRVTSARSWSISEVRGSILMAETDGVATSTILSANCASCSRGISPDEAKTMRTWLGRR